VQATVTKGWTAVNINRFNPTCIFIMTVTVAEADQNDDFTGFDIGGLPYLKKNLKQAIFVCMFSTVLTKSQSRPRVVSGRVGSVHDFWAGRVNRNGSDMLELHVGLL